MVGQRMLVLNIILQFVIVHAIRSTRDEPWLTFVQENNNSFSLINQTENDIMNDTSESMVFEYDEATENSLNNLNRIDPTNQNGVLFNDSINYVMVSDNTSLFENDTTTFIFKTEFVSFEFYADEYISRSLLKYLSDDSSFIDIHDAVEQSVTTKSGNIDLVPLFMASRSFCPFMSICTEHTIVDLNLHDNRCCIDCSCSKICKDPSNCCESLSRSTLNQFNRCTENLIGDPTMIAGSLGVMTAFVCEDNTDQDLVRKCHNLDWRDMNLRQLIPVYGKTTKRLYMNSYCAQCNNEKAKVTFSWQSKTIEPWATDLICEDASLLIQRLNEILVEPFATFGLSFMRPNGCYMKWSPNYNYTRCIVPEILIDKCRNDSFTDATVRLLCGTIEAPVRGMLGLYLNIYCLICNEGYSRYEDKCGTDFYDIHENFYDIRTKKRRVVLRIPENVVDLIAENGQIDSFNQKPPGVNSGQGMIEVCPITAMTFAGRCINVINELKGIGVDFILKIIFPTVSMNQSTHADILREVRSYMSDNSDGSNICVERILSMHHENDNTIAVVQLTKMVTDSLDIRNEYTITKQRLEDLNKNLTSSFLSSIQFYPSPLKLVEDGPVTFAVFADAFESPNCGRAIAMTHMQFCDTCLLNNAVHLNNNTIEINSVRFTAGEYLMKPGTSRSILVCCEHYRTRYNEQEAFVESGIGLLYPTMQIVVMMLSMLSTIEILMI